MLNRKKCENCDEKIKGSHNFCHSCGIQIKEPSKDWGMLGKKDTEEIEQKMPKVFGGGISGSIMNKMLGNAMKMLEKEMQKEMKMQKKHPQSDMQLFINGKRIEIPNGQQVKSVQKDKPQISSSHFSEANQKKFISLEEKEPKTELKRIGDTISYEINLPQVKSLNDTSIVKLENSVEIKAISKENAYFKSIPINLPLTSYDLNNEKLILEFESRD